MSLLNILDDIDLEFIKEKEFLKLPLDDHEIDQWFRVEEDELE